MTITIPHRLGQQEAVSRIDKGLEGISGSVLPGGIRVTEVTKSWSGNVLNLSIRVGKFLLNTTVSGRIIVNQEDLVFEIDLPPMLSALLPSDKLREGLKALGNRLVG